MVLTSRDYFEVIGHPKLGLRWWRTISSHLQIGGFYTGDYIGVYLCTGGTTGRSSNTVPCGTPDITFRLVDTACPMHHMPLAVIAEREKTPFNGVITDHEYHRILTYLATFGGGLYRRLSRNLGWRDVLIHYSAVHMLCHVWW
jgi:hypothetical protein